MQLVWAQIYSWFIHRLSHGLWWCHYQDFDMNRKLEVKARDFELETDIFFQGRRFLLWNFPNGLIALLDQAEQFENQYRRTVYVHFYLIMNQLKLKLIRLCQENRNCIQYMVGPCTLWLSWKLRKVIKFVKIVILQEKWKVIMKHQSKWMIFGNL